MDRKVNAFFIILSLNIVFQTGFSSEQDPCSSLTQNLIARINGGITKSFKLHDGSADNEDAGKQPDLEDCAAESWAEYEAGKLDSCITSWYFNQFFKSPKENGLESLANAAGLDPGKPIITFELHTNICLADLEKLLCKTDNTQYKNIKDILNDFEILFSLDEGRKLAWRTLVEIYRLNGAVEKIISQVGTPKARKARKAGRYLTINITSKNSLTPANTDGDACSRMALKMESSKNKEVISSLYDDKCYYISEEDKQEKPRAISIGHEWTHWFHSLRNPVRFDKDQSGDRGNANFFLSKETISSFLYSDIVFAIKNDIISIFNNKDLTNMILLSNINRIYEDLKRKAKYSMLPWTDTTKELLLLNKKIYSHEEHLTICGAPLSLIDNKIFFWGDEMSENKLIVSYNKLFSRNFSIRAGHSDFPFWEDKKVIENLCGLCGFNLNDISKKTLVNRDNQLYNSFIEHGLFNSRFKKEETSDGSQNQSLESQGKRRSSH